MKTLNPRTAWLLGLAGAAVVAVVAVFTPGCTCGPRARAQATTVAVRTTYHDWDDSVKLTSDVAEVMVVPQVGRIMSYRFLDGENVLWEDRSLDGQSGDPRGREWVNFGGDKTWPSPEADWGKHTRHQQWMPPAAFDALPVKARIIPNGVELTSPVDPHYGIRTIRRILLNGARLNITTTYEKMSGEPIQVGIWVITQFKDPVAVCVPIRKDSRFPGGHFAFDQKPWPQLQAKEQHLEITRDPAGPHKMGSDAQRLLWVGEKDLCLITNHEQAGEYPDRGARTEVYTNPNPKTYVELETLGPLSNLKSGEKLSYFGTYHLHRRSGMSVAEAVRRFLGTGPGN